jgi:hypothetical protein
VIGVRTPAVTMSIACVLLGACERQHRDVRPSPTRLAIYGDAAKEDAIRPGGPINPQPVINNPYNASPYDISEGQRFTTGLTAAAAISMAAAVSVLR